MSRTISTRRTRRRRDTEAPSRTLAKGVATLTVLGLVLYVGLTSYNGVPGRDYAKLYVDVPAIGNLIGHDPVRIAGVRVGQVKHIAVSRRGQARVELQLEPGTDIPADTTVRIRANGLLGARYVQLIPGTSSSLVADGGALRGAPDALSFGVPDTLDTLDRPTREGLGALVDGVGTGMLGNGQDLNRGLDAVADAAPRFTGLADALLERPDATARLIPALDRMMQPLDASRGDLAGMLAPGARALEPFAAERDALRTALDVAPGALTAATGGLQRGRRLIAATDALARSANRTLPSVPTGLRAAARLLGTSDGALRRATTLLRSAGPAVPAALRVTDRIPPVLPQLRSILDDGLPMIRYIAPRACDIENFGTVMRSMTGYGGAGRGPLGPSMEFRAQLVPTPEAVSPGTMLSAIKKDAYAAPCKYLSKAYPYVAASGGDR